MADMCSPVKPGLKQCTCPSSPGAINVTVHQTLAQAMCWHIWLGCEQHSCTCPLDTMDALVVLGWAQAMHLCLNLGCHSRTSSWAPALNLFLELGREQCPGRFCSDGNNAQTCASILSASDVLAPLAPVGTMHMHLDLSCKHCAHSASIGTRNAPVPQAWTQGPFRKLSLGCKQCMTALASMARRQTTHHSEAFLSLIAFLMSGHICHFAKSTQSRSH